MENSIYIIFYSSSISDIYYAVLIPTKAKPEKDMLTGPNIYPIKRERTEQEIKNKIS